MKKLLLLLLLACVVFGCVGEVFGDFASEVADLQQVVTDSPGTDAALAAQGKLVVLYVKQRMDTEAQAAYAAMLNDYADNAGLPRALYYVADAYRKLKHYVKARDIHKSVVNNWPQAAHACDSQTWVVRTNLLLGDYPAAVAETQKLLTDFDQHEDIAKDVDRLANVYRKAKKYPDALSLFTYAVEHWPHTEWGTKAQEKLTTIYIEQGRLTEAYAACQKLITDFANNPGLPEAINNVGDAYCAMNKSDKALEMYEYAIAQWPGSQWATDAQKRLARMYIQIGDYENAAEAVEKLKTEFSASPSFVAALEDVGDKYELNYSSREAYNIYKYLLQNWPTDDRAIWIQMKATLSQIRLKDLAKANTELSNLLNDFAGNKDLAPMVHEVVEEYRNAGLYEESRGLFAYILENWTQDEATNLELQTGLALQSIKLGELDKAKSATDKLIADYNDHQNIGKALFQIGEEYYYAKDYHDCIKVLRRIEKDYPDAEFATKNEIPYVLAACYRLTEQSDKAIEYYKLSMEKYPNGKYSYRVPYRLGLQYRNAGNPDEAIYWLQRQRELYPDPLYVQRASFEEVAIHYWDIKDYPFTIDLAREYLREYPDEEHTWPSYYLIAKSYEKMGNKTQAIAVLQEALQKFIGTKRESAVKEQLARMQQGGRK